MPELQVLLVAGTHGNEINAPWLLDQWKLQPTLIETHALKVKTVIGNPLAKAIGKRYVDRDLNRSFSANFLSSSSFDAYEIKRAQELIDLHGPEGISPCQIAIDFHSTTSDMGACVVVYGRRPLDLAIASLIQFKMGLPIYLHEDDDSQQGFLVESWPCGLVVEIGPVSQGLLDKHIVNQTLIMMQILLELISQARSGTAEFPEKLIVHKHLKSIDFPRDLEGNQSALIHPSLTSANWSSINQGQPIFQSADDNIIELFDKELPEQVVPVFINEAAYMEKGIAMSFTVKENLVIQDQWKNQLYKFLI